ncbi:hypothetical protein [Flavobacterium silvaticum]|uniref:Uncharacterized protein n=1 Tax=Flavobacterium silvaticum TaxID=1852020 RepID=A0A972FXU7_9FLAO|nr:hypothetical protein [Flavobacterium silvaticum]NMH29630.1 hypothetical protein [Flavobacterium silvaticum]
MDYNLIGYFLYLVITAFIILWVGHICYKNGNVFVAQLIPGHEDLCIRVNKILLAGYYLLNIGYCLITLVQWDTLQTLPDLIETVALKSAMIISIISILHYINIYVITHHTDKILNSL